MCDNKTSASLCDLLCIIFMCNKRSKETGAKRAELREEKCFCKGDHMVMLGTRGA